MKHLTLFENFQLNELILHGFTNPKKMFMKTAILYRADLWIVDYKTYPKVAKEICDKIGIDYKTADDLDNLLDWLKKDDYAHVIWGDINHPYFEVDNNRDYRMSRLSSDVNKLMKALKLTQIKVRATDYIYGNVTVDSHETPDDIRNLKTSTFYHGTCIKYFMYMKNKGLAPINISGAKSNYGDIVHKDKVFVTLNRETAYAHSYNSGEVNNSFPIILELQIPDISKLDVDYDLAINYLYDHPKTSKLGYREISTKVGTVGRNTDVDNIEHKVGDYAYLGRIPAQFIKSVLIDTKSYMAYLSDKHDKDYFDWADHYDEMEHQIDSWKSFTLTQAYQFIEAARNAIFGEHGAESEDDVLYDEDEN